MKPKWFKSLAKAEAWLLRHGRGKSLHIVILHDEWCTHGPNNPCNCRPDYVIEDLTVDNYLSGQRQQQQWFTRHERN